MTLTLETFNALSRADAQKQLLRACGASSWASAVTEQRPYATVEELLESARRAWLGMKRSDILEAFSHHPRIGADIEMLRQKFSQTAELSEGEQAGVARASEETLEALRDGNLAYEARYGHIFIVCATGKSAEEMLGLLRARMDNSPERELQIAAAEQAKITELRLRGIFSA